MKINNYTDLSSEEPSARATPELPKLRGRQELSFTWKSVTMTNEAADDSPTTVAIAIVLLMLAPVAGAGLCMYICSLLGAGAVGIGVSGLAAFVILMLGVVLLFCSMRARPPTPSD